MVLVRTTIVLMKTIRREKNLHSLADLRNLINQLEQAIEEIAKLHDVEHLAGPQGHVLYYLEKHEQEEIFVKNIEKQMKISKSVASNLVKRMAKNGFIEIVASTEDKRYKQVMMTELGRSKLALLKAWHQDMVEQLFSNIPHEDFRVVKGFFKQLEENIENYKEKEHV